MRIFLILLVLLSPFSVFAEESKEKDRLAVMDVQDKDSLFNQKTKGNITDYIFGKLAGTKLYWMIPKSDRDTALEQTIEKTKQDSRKECVDEKCQLSLVAELQANFLINTEIKKLFESTCLISIKKFDMEKRAGTDAFESKFNCTEKGAYEAIDSLNFGGKKKGSSFQEEKVVSKDDAVLNPSGGSWSKKSPNEMTWDDAKSYCANLNEDGYSEWRLPTISELRTLIQNCPVTETGGKCKIDNNCLSSSCDSDNCRGCSISSDGKYSKLGDTSRLWSSSEPSDYAGSAWSVGFDNGRVSSRYKGSNAKFNSISLFAVCTNLKLTEKDVIEKIDVIW